MWDENLDKIIYLFLFIILVLLVLVVLLLLLRHPTTSNTTTNNTNIYYSSSITKFSFFSLSGLFLSRFTALSRATRGIVPSDHQGQSFLPPAGSETRQLNPVDLELMIRILKAYLRSHRKRREGGRTLLHCGSVCSRACILEFLEMVIKILSFGEILCWIFKKLVYFFRSYSCGYMKRRLWVNFSTFFL